MNRRQRLLTAQELLGGALTIYVNRAEEDFLLEYHAHDFIEIAYVSSGAGFHHDGGRVTAVSKGDLFVLPIGAPHVFRPASAGGGREKLAVCNVVFSEAVLERAAALAPELPLARLLGLAEGGLSGAAAASADEPGGAGSRGRRAHPADADSPRAIAMRDGVYALEPLLAAMHEEFAAARPGSGAVLFALLVRLLVALARMRLAPEPAAAAPRDAIGLAADELRRRYAEPLTIADMARQLRMSERHFFRLFKQRTGLTFHVYLQHVRIDAACALLLRTSGTVAAVAEAVGYRDLPSFTRVFKRITGTTPAGYRKARRPSG